MIVVYPFSMIDQDLALKNANWMHELGGCKGHQVLVIHDKRCVPSIADDVCTALAHSFDEVHRVEAGAEIDGWPEGANYFFRLANSWLEQRGYRYYLWMEPDAIPLIEGWLDKLDAEFKAAKRPFMGDRVQVEDIPLHMSGIGFYPVPLHTFAGEAYRAAEIAFDMAGKDQIVPRAYFTKLIEHAWKHPKFTSIDELATQIRPECILFHSSKDGSLIDLVKAKRGSAVVPSTASSAAHQPPPTTYQPSDLILPPGIKPVPLVTCDIFIRTYPGDYEWLGYCLHSIRKFATGFRKIWVVSPEKTPLGFEGVHENTEWLVRNDECEDGYLAQQITKLYADVFTDYQPDNILHVDSDVIFSRPVTPQDFFNANGQPVWYYTHYAAIETPWQPITEKFMGMTVQYEFMRRLPMMIPRWLYPKLREFCHKRHGVIISDYIRQQPPRAFSEFNALGAYAYAYHQDAFHWVDTLTMATQAPVARQFHSWGGITPQIKQEINEILGEKQPPPPIKVLPNGLWVLKDDQISQWVEQEGRLDHDQNFLPDILPHIKEGDTVIDVGAFIGDHTIAYAKKVGDLGTVYAFEPNPDAFRCLRQNLLGFENVHLCNTGLGDKSTMAPLSGNNGNSGGAYIGEHMKVADVKLEKLDDMMLQPNFIKIDVEGYEPKVLDGMQKTLELYHPTLVIEVNVEALKRHGFKPADIHWRLERHGYHSKIIQDNCNPLDPMYDILCIARSSVSAEAPEVTPSVLPLSIEDCVARLKEIASRGGKEKGQVMWHLVKAGLKEPNPKNKKKNAKKTH